MVVYTIGRSANELAVCRDLDGRHSPVNPTLINFMLEFSLFQKAG